MKKKQYKKPSMEAIMQLNTHLGSFIIAFIDSTHLQILTMLGNPVIFYGVHWNIWQNMTLTDAGWIPTHRLGSSRVSGDEIWHRRDRQQMSEVAARKIQAAIIEGIYDFSGHDEFIKCIEEADKRANMKQLSELRVKVMGLQNEIDQANERIKEIERFSV